MKAGDEGLFHGATDVILVTHCVVRFQAIQTRISAMTGYFLLKIACNLRQVLIDCALNVVGQPGSFSCSAELSAKQRHA